MLRTILALASLLAVVLLSLAALPAAVKSHPAAPLLPIMIQTMGLLVVCTFLSSDGPTRAQRPDTSMTATHSPVRSRDCA